MGSSPCSHESWLELSLGLRSVTNKNLQDHKEDHHHEIRRKNKVICCDDDEDHDHQHLEEDQNLELRLQIGPNYSNHDYKINYNNMRIMDLMSLFHRDLYCFNALISSSPSPANSPGLWFSLLSSPNRKGEAALPQIPKPYIRVKDEKMTVLMVKKYLLTKLALSNQPHPQVELWCMGERLLESQSLKQVRDGIWLPKLVEFVNSNSSLSTSSIFHHCSHHHNQNQNQTPSSTTNYLMSLHYGTASFF